MGPGLGWADRPGLTGLGPSMPSCLPPSCGVGSRVFYILPLLHVGPCRQFLSELDVAPCPTRFDTFLGRSSEFVIFSSLVPRILGVMFASLHDLYGALRSSHKMLDELIPEVFLSTSKPCINTKLKNRHARMNLLYQGG
jgi:hypothetical protein